MITHNDSRFVELRHGDSAFTFSPDGLQLVSRAGIEIMHSCPARYAEIIRSCLHHGWLRPVAYMRDTELTMELLRK
jgi:hypothetical protein